VSSRRKKSKASPAARPRQSIAPEARRSRQWLWAASIALAAVLAGYFGTSWFIAKRAAGSGGVSAAPAQPSDEQVFATYAGSSSCRECHTEQFELWEKSHHALAERPVQPALDRAAFEPARSVKHGTQTSEARVAGGHFEVVTLGAEKRRQPHRAERAIGVDPLVQYLVAGARGRWQTLEVAHDPHRGDWFNVYGDEDRQPGEWGHWTGRGMTWNSMCASCHNTRLRKNYDPATDTYHTRAAEVAVGCESCHGPMRAHTDWQRKYAGASPKPADPTATRFSRDQMLNNCAPCHARRGELTGDFVPGENFFDHYTLTIPDETDVFYPDGQVRDEDYEFTSFLSSRMHAAGVRCADCHEPHSGKTRVPGNQLCLTCHAGAPPSVPGLPTVPKIDPIAHSHHRSETEPGGRCVDCHMPLTTYMQRHPRRDHGFTIPDPLLTKQFGVPNACNRCHADKSADWSLGHVEQWYGDKMNRHSRSRAQWMAMARTNAPSSPANLQRLLAVETNALWRAVGVGLARRWLTESNLTESVLRHLTDAHPLVRATAVQTLEPLAAQPGSRAQAAVQNLLRDPVRNVRVAAAWALRATLETNSPAGGDLFRHFAQTADQPGGQMQQGIFHFDRANPQLAAQFFRRATEWDPGSAPPHHELAVALSQLGRAEEAVAALRAALKLAPNEAEYHYKLGLALNETGDTAGTLAALEQAVKLDPAHATAWYNLGLGYSALNRPGDALGALQRAIAAEPTAARFHYARATVLLRLNRRDEARQALRATLALEPNHPQARAAVQELGVN
jgi:Flp pilus assembly protein TadD